PDGREIQRIDRDPTSALYPHLSPDGKHLAAVEGPDFKLRLWRVADRKEILRNELLEIRGFVYAFSPDSRQLAVGRNDWVIRFDLATGREVNRWQLPEKRRAYHLAFHPDGRRLAVGYYSSNVVSVYDAPSGEPVANLPVGPTIPQQ